MAVGKSVAYMLCLMLAYSVNAQRLQIGSGFPEVELTGILNYSSDTLRISDVKRKLVILDFWNHHCISCIKSFPKLDSLQKVFKEDIQIILVNHESKDSTIRFFEERPKIKKPDLIMVTGDKLLSELFPVEGYPYSVWLDSSMKVRYFSGANSVHAKSVRNFLNAEDIRVANPTKINFVSPFDPRKFEYFSYLAKCNSARYIGSRQVSVAADTNFIHIASSCASVVDLYIKAYDEKDRYNFNTSYGLYFPVLDSISFFRPSEEEVLDTWREAHSYNYELYLPRHRQESAYRIMQDDLIRYFPVMAKVENRCVISAVLRVVDIEKIRTRGGAPVNTMDGLGYGKVNPDGYRFLINQPFSLLAKYLALMTGYYYPFYDETGLSFNIDIGFREESLSPFNMEKLNEDLSMAGLQLYFERRSCPVLCLSVIE